MEPLLEVLAGQALERALAEVLEERELAGLRARQAAYQQARATYRQTMWWSPYREVRRSALAIHRAEYSCEEPCLRLHQGQATSACRSAARPNTPCSLRGCSCMISLAEHLLHKLQAHCWVDLLMQIRSAEAAEVQRLEAAERRKAAERAARLAQAAAAQAAAEAVQRRAAASACAGAFLRGTH